MKNKETMERNIYKIGKELFITSNEEIKPNVYALINKVLCKTELLEGKIVSRQLVGGATMDICKSEYLEIILTTNQALIKDGVQDIDNEFLEWFVKNPSCEHVKVEKEHHTEIEEVSYEGDFQNVDYIKYKVIIPKEESKQELSLKINDEFLDTTSKEILYTLMEEFDNLVTENSSEETLEEAAERIFDGFGDITKPVVIKRAIELVKGQQERMYSEKESIQKIIDYVDFQFNTNGELNSEIKKWFEQFSKLNHERN